MKFSCNGDSTVWRWPLILALYWLSCKMVVIDYYAISIKPLRHFCIKCVLCAKYYATCFIYIEAFLTSSTLKVGIIIFILHMRKCTSEQLRNSARTMWFVSGMQWLKPLRSYLKIKIWVQDFSCYYAQH